jgi:hypothetical protein
VRLDDAPVDPIVSAKVIGIDDQIAVVEIDAR